MRYPALQIAKCDMEFFQQTGAVCLRNAFDEHWIDKLRRGVERNVATPSKFFATISSSGGEPTFIMDYNAWTSIPEYEEFVRRSPIGEIAGILMEWEEVNFIEDNIFCSRNGQSVPTLWHQDASYYEISGSICSIWVPLDDLTQEDCIAIVAGSHRWGRTFLPTSFSGKRERLYNEAEIIPAPFERMIDIDKDLEKYDILRWNMNVGDCIVLDGKVVHGKFRSGSGKSLRRITLRFVGEDAYWDKNDFPWLSLEMGHGGLRPGDRLNCELFPLIWSRK
jgi:ectoine hydroxylase-related dioxygenase (phytanoyl-CoA dioxygenase family)